MKEIERDSTSHDGSAAGDSTSSKLYKEFPASIRWAQRSFLLALAIPIVFRSALRGKVRWMLFAVWGASAACGLLGLFMTYYAVIRYPYMGLVDAADGDLYAKYIESKSKILFGFLKVAGLIAGVLLLIAPWLDGRLTPGEGLLLLYVVPVVGFMVFLVFRYSRLDHPTVATLLRCSMGLGVLLFPFFIPALMLGSMRGKALLDRAARTLEDENRYARPS